MRTAHYAPDYMPLEGSNGAPSSKDTKAATTGGDFAGTPYMPAPMIAFCSTPRPCWHLSKPQHKRLLCHLSAS